MNAIHIRPVLTAKERKIFLTFPWQIYRHDPLWVPPLLPDRIKTIDPERGSFFTHGYAEFFIAWKDNTPVGTICAAEDQAANRARGTRDCLFGFFECVEDYEVDEALFNHAIRWAKDHRLDALYGPFNLDYEDSYGVLVEGRDRPPVLLCSHTPQYYKNFIERLGFKPARGDNLAFAIDVKETAATNRLSRLAERVRRRSNFRIREADLNRWDDEIVRVHNLLNKALAHLPDHIPWHLASLRKMLEPFRQIVDPELVLFAEHEDRVI